MCRPKIVARVSVIGICANSQRSQGILKIRMLFCRLKILFISCSKEYARKLDMCRPKIVARVSVIGICANSQRSQGILKIRMLFYSLKILFISCSKE